MKQYYTKLSFLLFFISTSIFSLPCATTGFNTERGDTIEKVLKNCQKPYAEKSYTKNIIMAQKWSYFFPNQYNSNKNDEINFTFNADTLVNIRVNNFNLTNSSLCKMPLRIGNSLQQVFYACGEPNYKETLETEQVEIKEMQYSEIYPKIWIFEQGKLVDWK